MIHACSRRSPAAVSATWASDAQPCDAVVQDAHVMKAPVGPERPVVAAATAAAAAAGDEA